MLALAAPGETLAALVTVAGIWAVVIGVMRIIVAFEVKRLPEDVDEAFRDVAVTQYRAPKQQVPVA